MKVDFNGGDICVTFEEEEASGYMHQGACDDDCAFAVSKYRTELEKIPIDDARKAVRATGVDGVEDMDDDTVYQYVVWLAAGSAVDGDSITGYLSTY